MSTIFVSSRDITQLIPFLIIYVNDMLVVGLYMEEIKNLKMKLSKVFGMKDLGHAKEILNM